MFNFLLGFGQGYAAVKSVAACSDALTTSTLHPVARVAICFTTGVGIAALGPVSGAAGIALAAKDLYTHRAKIKSETLKLAQRTRKLFVRKPEAQVATADDYANVIAIR